MIVLRAPEILNTDLEWIEAGGLGGYAASSLTGRNTRREHALLCAAARPPESRQVLISRLDERLSEGASHFDLASVQFPGHATEGARWLSEVRVDLFVVFVYRAGRITLEKTVAAIHAEDTIIVRYSISSDELTALPHLELRPFAAMRPQEGLRRKDGEPVKMKSGVDWVQLESSSLPVWVHAPLAQFTAEPDWHFNFEYRRDGEDGRDNHEDLLTPGTFRFGVGISEAYIIISTQDPRERDPRALFEKEKLRRAALSETAARLLSYGTVTAGNASWETIKSNMAHHLALSLDSHVVWREDLRSTVSGYHSLPDRMRDALIAVPALCLLRGKETPARILRLAARHIKDGRIPSGFEKGRPLYEAVDTGFWFVLAVYRYLEITTDESLVHEMMPAVRSILAAVARGAGLTLAGHLPIMTRPGGTWMEEGSAWRSGYTVDVCALYCNALRIYSELLRLQGHDTRSVRLFHESESSMRAFQEKFWYEDGKRLYDAVWPDRRDRSHRPSQILALALPFPLFENEQADAILHSTGELLTDRGLRSLSIQDSSFREEAGNEGESLRFGATVSWLLPAYLSVLCSRKGEPGRMQAREILTRFYSHFSEALTGGVSGRFTGTGRPVGAVTSVAATAELFRLLCEEV